MAEQDLNTFTFQNSTTTGSIIVYGNGRGWEGNQGRASNHYLYKNYGPGYFDDSNDVEINFLVRRDTAAVTDVGHMYLMSVGGTRQNLIDNSGNGIGFRGDNTGAIVLDLIEGGSVDSQAFGQKPPDNTSVYFKLKHTAGSKTWTAEYYGTDDTYTNLQETQALTSIGSLTGLDILNATAGWDEGASTDLTYVYGRSYDIIKPSVAPPYESLMLGRPF